MSFFSQLKAKLSPNKAKPYVSGFRNTQVGLGEKLKALIGIKPTIEESLYADINDVLLRADLGVTMASELIRRLRQHVAAQKLTTTEELIDALAQLMRERFVPFELTFHEGLQVFLIVGINGAGKTTTIAKLANRFTREGKSVVTVAADTFRAAAVEQLRHWSTRVGVPCISGSPNADPASVVVDGLRYALSHAADVVLIDTAGRLENKTHLMDELAKIRRVIVKTTQRDPDHVWLILDGSTGQHALKQAQVFHETVEVTGIICTKLDGTAKGGSLVAIAHQLKLPIPFIGLGEGLEDLIPFDPDAFVYAITQEVGP
jgi:fused signal recognition particle receptor